MKCNFFNFLTKGKLRRIKQTVLPKGTTCKNSHIDFQKIHFARQQGGNRPFRPFPTDNAAKLFF